MTSADALAAKQEGNEHYRAGEYEKAVTSYTRAVNLAPENAIFLNNRAAAHLALRNLPAALADARASVAKEASFAKAHARLGSVLREMGNFRQAEASYAEASRLDSSNNSFKAMREDCRRSATGAGGVGALASFVRANLVDSLTFAVRLFLISQALMYMLPFVGKAAAGSAYSRVRVWWLRRGGRVAKSLPRMRSPRKRPDPRLIPPPPPPPPHLTPPPAPIRPPL